MAFSYVSQDGRECGVSIVAVSFSVNKDFHASEKQPSRCPACIFVNSQVSIREYKGAYS